MALLRVATVVATAFLCVLCAAPASARWYGSTLHGPANAGYGCESAIISAPLGGFVLAPTGQTSCTYRHGGYLFRPRPTFLVPRSGRITRIKVKSGPRPAKLRLTVLTGSSRVDTFTGRDLPGTYTCCTARYVGKPFRPKANRVTTKKVKVRVQDVRSKRLRYRIHSTDGLALTAVGPGTVPLSVGPVLGGYETGTPLLTGYFPYTHKGDPRVEGYSLTGIDLLFQWEFKRR